MCYLEKLHFIWIMMDAICIFYVLEQTRTFSQIFSHLFPKILKKNGILKMKLKIKVFGKAIYF